MKYLPLILCAVLWSCTGTTSQTDEANDTTYLDSGVKYVFLQKGSGEEVVEGKKVTTHINLIIEEDTVWSTYAADQSVFDFHAKKDPLIAGFDEVVMLTRQGDRILAVIPPELGYGSAGAGSDIPPNSTLKFDIEILKVEKGKLYLADTLYQQLTDEGIDAMIVKYEEVQYDTATYKIDDGQWRMLSRELRDEERYQDVIDVWTYRLNNVEDFGGYYQVAKAYEGLGDISNAIKSVERAIEIDTTNNETLTRYLEELTSE